MKEERSRDRDSDREREQGEEKRGNAYYKMYSDGFFNA